MGSSVEVAMSSRRDVAASSLEMRLAKRSASLIGSTMAGMAAPAGTGVETGAGKRGWVFVPLDEGCEVVHAAGRRHIGERGRFAPTR